MSAEDPLLLRAARGEDVEKVPVWMMRQAGRHLKVYRDLCKTTKSFRERSERVDLATEIRYVLMSYFSFYFNFHLLFHFMLIVYNHGEHTVLMDVYYFLIF